ncbi:MAG: nucleotidyltransferase family protein [Gracilimonas sp.]|uniref:nucleotidyltransferase family protein n=1 Tax=Gracilimonas sp. TaxID=1974203 RepID=UPI001B247DB1|nr:nucleotidyltransferase family protein [Gracilimonas sp.]MBO6587229.1 nucleotidyltransferase family protein [Gracilimonas sp.]MBO6614283.1 nucleotidyltransferase family protein [Gracilimonas sp.]
MRHFTEHLIESGTSIREALKVLDTLAKDAISFVVDGNKKLLGSLTDGDIRRGLIKGVELGASVDQIIQKNPKYIRKGNYDIQKVIKYRENDYRIIPILDKDDKVVNVINFGNMKSYLPVDVVIMAGGKGTRLRPLTEKTPKPLLKVGDKPILEHNIHRLSLFGMDDFWISVNYLGDQIEKYFGNGNHKNLNIDYVREEEPLGTIGSVCKIDNFIHDYVLVTNSDILTNLDYEDFFLRFREEEADFAVVTIPYKVDVPYAVLETSNGHVMSFKEKPTYTYYSNGGIYLMKREVTDRIPKNSFYDTTDLMEELIADGKKVLSYPLSGYWLDIGKHEDFEKAQEDIKSIKF